MQHNSSIDRLSLGLSSEHGVDGCPALGRDLEGDNLGEDFSVEGPHEVPLQLLLLRIPENTRHIDALLFFLVLGDSDGGQWHGARRIKEVLHLCALDLGQHDGLPHEVVVPHKLLPGGDPRDVVKDAVEDEEGAKVELDARDVARALMVLEVVEAVVMAIG